MDGQKKREYQSIGFITQEYGENVAASASEHSVNYGMKTIGNELMPLCK